MAPPKTAIAIARDKRDRINVGNRQNIGDKVCCHARQVPPSALLPRCDKRPRLRLVDECGPRRLKPESPATALRASTNGPWSRGPTSLAQRRAAAHEVPQARPTDRLTDAAADAAASREQGVANIHPTNARGGPVPRVLQVRCGFVPGSNCLPMARSAAHGVAAGSSRDPPVP